jgi:hypothetical protein
MSGLSPVQAYLQAELADARAALRESWPAAEQWEVLDAEARAQLQHQVQDAVRRVFAAKEAMRKLPATTACICPSCKKVTLPTTGDGRQFECCGHLWGPRPEHVALPKRFWDQAKPGDDFEGAIAAMWAQEGL